MNEMQQLLGTLKRQLKARGLTYKDVALALNLSEASVKRVFSTGNLTLDRFAALCELVDMQVLEVAQIAAAQRSQVQQLDKQQESELVSDPKLLLVAVCALNHWRLDDIVAHYQLDEAEALRHLLRLDRMRLIDLLPGNRIRINVARDFHWRPGGAIEHYFAEHGRENFLAGRFSGPHDSTYFVHGMLTPQARAEFRAQLEKLRQQFATLHDQSQTSPMGQRQGSAMLVAFRDWEPPAFQALRRPTRGTP